MKKILAIQYALHIRNRQHLDRYKIFPSNRTAILREQNSPI